MHAYTRTENHVFCLEQKTGEITAVASDFVQPNGLAFSPDERVLYVAESGRSHDIQVPAIVYAFDVTAKNKLENSRTFATIPKGIPDGLRVDREGHVWVSGAGGVYCFDADGSLLGRIIVPENVSNLAFGGPRGNMLFITATTSVYALHINAEAP
jgi:gluconolactonase